MFGGHADDVLSFPRQIFGHAANGQVVAFSGPAGEDDFLAACARLRPAFPAQISTASLAAQPKLCVVLPALPKTSAKYGRIASITRGSSGVVA